MPYFDSDFAAVDTMFAEAFGEPVVYVDGEGTETADEQAIVDPETLREVRTDRDRGTTKVRERKFSLRREAIEQPQLNGSVRYDGEKWPIVGYAGRDRLRTKVLCQIVDRRGRAVQGH